MNTSDIDVYICVYKYVCVNCFFKSFAHFSTGLFVFFHLSVEFLMYLMVNALFVRDDAYIFILLTIYNL